MKNSIKELTEGMQRLCAVANRIVAHHGEVGRIELDLLMEDLRRLYDVALRMADQQPAGGGQQPAASDEEVMRLPDDEMLSSTVMATMAAMSVPEASAQPEAPVAQPEATAEPEPAPAPATEPTPAVPAEPEPVAPPVAEPAPLPQPTLEELEDNGNSLLFDEIIIDTPANEPEPAPEPSPEPETAPEPAPAPTPANEPEQAAAPEPAEAPAPAPTQPHAGGQASLLDYLKRPVEEQPTVRTLGDSLGEQSAVSGQQSAVGGQQKVSDLRTVININDKFSFMSELFRNNMKAYNDFIMRLNAIDNRDEALVCVNEAAAQYKWDDASLAVQSFYKVFDKKF